MSFIKQYLVLLILSSSNTILLNSKATTITALPNELNSDNSAAAAVAAAKTIDSNTAIDGKESKLTISSQDPSEVDTTADEIKNEVSVKELLETDENSSVVVTPELHQGLHYEIDWNFIDKDTIRVTFDLYSVPKSLAENITNTEANKHKLNILATMATKPSNSLKSIYTLEYFLFIIRPYKQKREILLKMEKLILRNTTIRPYPHFTNALRLTSLNHHEKYSICICYYQKSSSVQNPDLLLCQDVINDYAKFAHLRTDAKHGLVFIGTQYSIILGLLIVLQSIYSMRKRRFAEYITQHLATKAQSIRTTLSSVSLVRQSFSSLDAAAEQHQQQQLIKNTSNSHMNQLDVRTEEGEKVRKRRISSQAIALNNLAPPTNDDVTSSDETEPFLRRVSSKNHVHFALGAGEGSEDDDDSHHIEYSEINKNSNIQSASGHTEPYGDQPDALSSMAHILDSNKPWSRHSDDTSPA